LCKILKKQEIKLHKVHYYLERRDPEFKQKMAEVLCVYREVKLIKEAAAAAKQELPWRSSPTTRGQEFRRSPHGATPATQAGVHATFARDHEYKGHGLPVCWQLVLACSMSLATFLTQGPPLAASRRWADCACSCLQQTT
jgi:hypothetical protein